jgi:tetratricopeptide (TPR) repeat protein
MAIQARAFLRFKQGQYEDALRYFHQLIEIMGPNEQIYENMALTYSRLNDFKEATICYARAILLIRQKPPEEQKITTLLLGLSTVLDDPNEALIVLNESLRLLKLQYDKPHSLMAKTLSGMGDLQVKRHDLKAAGECYAEAVKIFIDTCGYETPLTANAMNKQAKNLLAQQRNAEAIQLFLDALQVWIKVDAHSFEPNAILEALLAFRTLAEEIPSAQIISILDALKDKIAHTNMLSHDINTLCLLKFIYELYIIKGDIPRAEACCCLFRDLLVNLDERQLGANISHRNQLLDETIQLLSIIEKIPKKTEKNRDKKTDFKETL